MPEYVFVDPKTGEKFEAPKPTLPVGVEFLDPVIPPPLETPVKRPVTSEDQIQQPLVKFLDPVIPPPLPPPIQLPRDPVQLPRDLTPPGTAVMPAAPPVQPVARVPTVPVEQEGGIDQALERVQGAREKIRSRLRPRGRRPLRDLREKLGRQ